MKKIIQTLVSAVFIAGISLAPSLGRAGSILDNFGKKEPPHAYTGDTPENEILENFTNKKPPRAYDGDVQEQKMVQVIQQHGKIVLSPSAICAINYQVCLKKNDNDDECYEVFLYCEQLAAEQQNTEKGLLDNL